MTGGLSTGPFPIRRSTILTRQWEHFHHAPHGRRGQEVRDGPFGPCGSVPAVLTAFADASLFGAAYGDGEPWVLALHGWGRTHEDFADMLAPAGGEALDAIALDLPGFGSTPAPPGAWGSADYADAVRPVLGEMAERVVVVGHSFGGRVAVQLAARAPDRIAGLVLSGAPLLRVAPRRKPPLRYRAVRRLAGRRLVPGALLERYRERYGSPDYRAAAGSLRPTLVRVLAEDYGDVLARLRCPVELVWGTEDREVPVEVAYRLHELLACSRLTTCPGVGHLTPLAAAGALRAAVERVRP